MDGQSIRLRRSDLWREFKVTFQALASAVQPVKLSRASSDARPPSVCIGPTLENAIDCRDQSRSWPLRTDRFV